jgi:hypothetical protein
MYKGQTNYLGIVKMLKMNNIYLKRQTFDIRMETKSCSKCKEIKSVDMFLKHKTSKSGYAYQCKECQIEAQRKRREKQKVEDPKKYHKKWSDYYQKVKERHYEVQKLYLSIPENRKKRNEYVRNYKAKKREEDKSFKLYENLRKRIWKSLKNKSNSSKELLGCEIDYYFKWINHTMKDEMSWDNYGKLWNIDHLIPIKTFDISNPEEALKAFNWKNTWAMKSDENFSKKNNIIDSQISVHKKLLDEFVKLNPEL